MTAWLFVPGQRPDRFAKAWAAGPDEVILDLEDAVPPPDKDGARAAVTSWLGEGGSGWVRINASGTEWFDADVTALAAAPGLRGVVLPKSEDVDVLARLRDRLPLAVGVIALVESARGVRDVDALAACDAVDQIAFGSIDYCLDLGAAHDDSTLLLPRSRIVVASRAAGKPGPVDGVTVDLSDDAALSADAARARGLGFGGKLCIHPKQVAPVRRAFAPSDEEIDWAERVIAADAASGGAPTVLDGTMVDRPVVDHARQTLAARFSA